MPKSKARGGRIANLYCDSKVNRLHGHTGMYALHRKEKHGQRSLSA